MTHSRNSGGTGPEVARKAMASMSLVSYCMPSGAAGRIKQPTKYLIRKKRRVPRIYFRVSPTSSLHTSDKRGINPSHTSCVVESIRTLTSYSLLQCSLVYSNRQLLERKEVVSWTPNTGSVDDAYITGGHQSTAIPLTCVHQLLMPASSRR